MIFIAMEGFNTMEMGIKLVEKIMKPNYSLVGFDLGKGGGEVGTSNASCD